MSNVLNETFIPELSANVINCDVLNAHDISGTIVVSLPPNNVVQVNSLGNGLIAPNGAAVYATGSTFMLRDAYGDTHVDQNIYADSNILNIVDSDIYTIAQFSHAQSYIGSVLKVTSLTPSMYVATNSSNNLVSVAAPATVTITGTTNEIIVTGSSPNFTLSTPQPIAATSNPEFASLTTSTGNIQSGNNFTLQISKGIYFSNGSNPSVIFAQVPSMQQNNFIPVTGTNNPHFIMDASYAGQSISGNLTVTANVMANSLTVIPAGQIAFGQTNPTYITATVPGALQNVNIPDTGNSSSNFVMDQGTQTLNGTYTITNPIQGNFTVASDIFCDALVVNQTGAIAFGPSNPTFITATVPAGIQECNIPDTGATPTNFVMDEGTQTLNGEYTINNLNYDAPISTSLSFLCIGTGTDGSITIFPPFTPNDIITLNSTYAINSSTPDFAQATNNIIFNGGHCLNPTPVYMINANFSFTTPNAGCNMSFYIGTTGGSYDSLTQCSIDCPVANQNYAVSCSGIEAFNPGDSINMFVSCSVAGGSVVLVNLTASYIQVS